MVLRTGSSIPKRSMSPKARQEVEVEDRTLGRHASTPVYNCTKSRQTKLVCKQWKYRLVWTFMSYAVMESSKKLTCLSCQRKPPLWLRSSSFLADTLTFSKNVRATLTCYYLFNVLKENKYVWQWNAVRFIWTQVPSYNLMAIIWQHKSIQKQKRFFRLLWLHPCISRTHLCKEQTLTNTFNKALKTGLY